MLKFVTAHPFAAVWRIWGIHKVANNKVKIIPLFGLFKNKYII